MRLIDADALKDKCYITVRGTTIGRNNYVMFHEIDDAPMVERKCDKAMRRSKERCSTPVYNRWRCTGECQNCVCGMRKKEDGTWEHNK